MFVVCLLYVGIVKVSYFEMGIFMYFMLWEKLFATRRKNLCKSDVCVMIGLSAKELLVIIKKGTIMKNVVTTAWPNEHLSVRDFIGKAYDVIMQYQGHKDFEGHAVKALIKRATTSRRGAQLVIGRSVGERQTALIYHDKKGFMLVDYTDINLSTQRLTGLSPSERVRPYVCNVVYSWTLLSLDDYMMLCDCIEELNRFAL